MKKIFVTIFILGFVLAFYLPQSFASNSDNGVGEIFFVSSIEELAKAENYGDKLKGLAISVQFYNQLDGEFLKKKIERLVAYIISLKFRPVCVYGQPFDREVAKKLLSDEDGSNCTPTAFAGIFPTIYLDDNSTTTIEMCTADSNLTEKQYRRRILRSWQLTKKTIEKWGCKLLE